MDESLRHTCWLIHSFFRAKNLRILLLPKTYLLRVTARGPSVALCQIWGSVSDTLTVETGVVLDYEMLCKFWRHYEAHKDDEWGCYAPHALECDKNYEGSSPVIETEGWLRLVQRNVAFATKLSCQMVTQSHMK